MLNLDVFAAVFGTTKPDIFIRKSGQKNQILLRKHAGCSESTKHGIFNKMLDMSQLF